MTRDAQLVGRDREIAEVADLIDPRATGRGVVVLGNPGIGKTTLWAAAVAAARRDGVLVLSARPAAPEAGLTFVGLADLLRDIGSDALASLRPAERHALSVALLREEPAAIAPGERQISAAFLGLLRDLAARGPLLVAIDDVSWLDAASSRILAFAIRRLEDVGVRFLFSRRPGRPSPVERALAAGDLGRVDVGPLTFGAIRAVLARRLALPLTRRVIEQIYEATGGNPLFALEVGRLVGARRMKAGEDLPIPPIVDELLDDRIASLTTDVRRLLAGVSLGVDLASTELALLADPLVVDAALEGEVVVDDDGRLRPAHPLLAAAVRARLSSAERRALHRDLAAVSADDEVRARHLALGTAGTDLSLARRVGTASQRAAARGALGDAVALAEHALRLTPRGDPSWSEALLALAGRLMAAGEHRRVSEVLGAEFEGLPAGRARIRARLLLSDSDFHNVNVRVAVQHLEAARAESASTPDLRALASARWSRYLSSAVVERIAEAERVALDDLPAAVASGPLLEREILFALAFARKLQGRPIDDLLDRARAVSPEAFEVWRSVDRISAGRLASRGDVGPARAELERLLELAEGRGEGWSSMWLRHELSEVAIRAGDWTEASRLLDDCDESPDRGVLDPQGYARCRALAAAGRGRVAEARELAESVIAACRVEGLRWNLLEAQRACGQAAILAHEPALAAELLMAVWTHTADEGVEEPGEFPVAPDLVEALVDLGRLGVADSVNRRLRELAEAQMHPWGLATALRGETLVAMARGSLDAGLTSLGEAADQYLALGLRFDHARTLRAAGSAARRRRRWGEARQLLERAVAAFESIGSDGWAADARAELARVGGRRRQPGVLSEAEQRVAELAAGGLSNKEIATRLVVGVATVESHLRHVYAKLDVPSRTHLAARLSGTRVEESVAEA